MRRTALLVALLGSTACGSSAKDVLVRSDAAGEADADAAADAGPSPMDAGGDADPTLGGPCVDATQCDDSLACTFDTCDPALHRCRNAPDDSLCDDHVFRCVRREDPVVRARGARHRSRRRRG